MQCLTPVTIRSPGKSGVTWVKGNPQLFITVPCGKCVNCLKTKTNEKVYRLLTEAEHWKVQRFVTFTFDDDHLCDLDSAKHLIQNFHKILRKHDSQDFKFFVVPEYGDRTSRLHFHGLYFTNNLGFDALLQRFWNYGFISIGDVQPASVRYVCKYINKQEIKSRVMQSKGIGLSCLTLRFCQWFIENMPLTLSFRGHRYPVPKYLYDKIFGDDKHLKTLYSFKRIAYYETQIKNKLDKYGDDYYRLMDSSFVQKQRKFNLDLKTKKFKL